MKKIVCLAPAALAVMASTVHAHPGHDHSHWSSTGIHALFYIALGAATVAGIAAAVKYAKKSK